MVIFRKVLGPFHPLIETASGRVEKMQWHFIVIRDDFTTAHYTLQFYPLVNKFTAVNGDQNEDSLGRRVRAMGHVLWGYQKPPVIHERMFIENDKASPLTGDTISAILKQRLREEDIANITQVRILGRLP